MSDNLLTLANELQGELYFDDVHKVLYATDASAYREIPEAVTIPANIDDLKKLIKYANKNKTSLIPRTGGTSLAGQVVGKGIVVDMSKYFTKILEVNTDEHWVRVQPGVIRDELNMFLNPLGFFFAPETSTANRAMMAGMVGNNSCGSNSVVYGSTRDHLLEVKTLLSDGSEATFKTLSEKDFRQKVTGTSLEAKVYQNIQHILSDPENRKQIEKEFPKATVTRRNTGYALDALMNTAPFQSGGKDFNFCKLIAGSEGTLALITEIKLNILPLPKGEVGLMCAHFKTIDDSLRANLIALKHHPNASELIDHFILERTKENVEQNKNRFFVQGDPEAILVIEFPGANREEISAKAKACEDEMRAAGLGYHFPVLFGDDTKRIWSLRKAGLGLLGNIPGDEKPAAVIEDTAVDVQDLPAYIRDFNKILQKYNLSAVHYAHAGSGELHLRPILNLKTKEGNHLYKTIAQEIATLVKSYQGSLSGEHGDGRLRGEFIPQMVGEKNYQHFKDIKRTWDPHYIFNPNKIVDTPPMNTQLRYEPGQNVKLEKTVFRFYNQNILQHAEQCNGTGECRKTHLTGGTMCPSYMATKNEKDTTRARANIMREVLTHSTKANKYDSKEIHEVMDNCLSCKGCKSECPSDVDVAKLKAEFLQHYYDANGVPFRSKLIANFTRMSAFASRMPGIYNFVISTPPFSNGIKWVSGFAQKRSLPKLEKTTFKKWFSKRESKNKGGPKVYVFCDEFTNYNDVTIGKKAILLLEGLGYEVALATYGESGRTWLSKGLIRQAKKIANKNIEHYSNIISAETPLLGIEPSAILAFRDEYVDLADDDNFRKARTLAKNVFYIDEFLSKEIKNGHLSQDSFTQAPAKIKLAGHCHQKALSSFSDSVKVLSFPKNYTVETIPSGCCGMAGSFGYEKEHYDLAMQIGELVLFPAVRNAEDDTLIVTPGTSCRHQIKDGVHKKSFHPVEVLYDALVEKEEL